MPHEQYDLTISTACSNAGGPENCQLNIFSLESGLSNINMYCLSTVGTTNMITQDGGTIAVFGDNINVYPDTIALFQPNAVNGGPTPSPSNPNPPATTLSTATQPQPTGGWTFRGCWTDNVNARTLTVGSVLVGAPGTKMTIEGCLAACGGMGYVYAGVEYSAECCKSILSSLHFPFRFRSPPLALSFPVTFLSISPCASL